eukprot:832330-Prymnesium_polylepis.2
MSCARRPGERPEQCDATFTAQRVTHPPRLSGACPAARQGGGRADRGARRRGDLRLVLRVHEPRAMARRHSQASGHGRLGLRLAGWRAQVRVGRESRARL